MNSEALYQELLRTLHLPNDAPLSKVVKKVQASGWELPLAYEKLVKQAKIEGAHVAPELDYAGQLWIIDSFLQEKKRKRKTSAPEGKEWNRNLAIRPRIHSPKNINREREEQELAQAILMSQLQSPEEKTEILEVQGQRRNHPLAQEPTTEQKNRAAELLKAFSGLGGLAEALEEQKMGPDISNILPGISNEVIAYLLKSEDDACWNRWEDERKRIASNFIQLFQKGCFNALDPTIFGKDKPVQTTKFGINKRYQDLLQFSPNHVDEQCIGIVPIDVVDRIKDGKETWQKKRHHENLPLITPEEKWQSLFYLSGIKQLPLSIPELISIIQASNNVLYEKIRQMPEQKFAKSHGKVLDWVAVLWLLHDLQQVKSPPVDLINHLKKAAQLLYPLYSR